MARQYLMLVCLAAFSLNLGFASAQVPVQIQIQQSREQFSADVNRLEKEYAKSVSELQSKLEAEVVRRRASLLLQLKDLENKSLDARDLDSANAARQATKQVTGQVYTPTTNGTKSFSQNALAGVTGKLFWMPLSMEFRNDGKLYRVDGQPRNRNDTFWRVSNDGVLEILDEDGKTVTSTYVGIRTKDGTYAIGKLAHSPIPVMWWFDNADLEKAQNR